MSVRLLKTAVECSPRLMYRPILFHWSMVPHISALGFWRVRSIASQKLSLQKLEVILSVCSHTSGLRSWGSRWSYIWAISLNLLMGTSV